MMGVVGMVGVAKAVRKAKIPKALREQVWLTYNKTQFNSKCWVKWCNNVVTPFNFQVGHNVPESRGGSTDIPNLRPICASCNLSMGSRYSIDEFSNKFDAAISVPDKPAPAPEECHHHEIVISESASCFMVFIRCFRPKA